MTRQRTSLLVWVRFAMIIAIWIPTSLLLAQVQFSERPSEIDITRYDFIEKCDGGIRRIEQEEKVRAGVLQDTVRWNQSESQIPLPAAVVEFAKKCMDRWPVSSVSPNDTVYARMMRLYLAANRDADAEELARRRIARDIRKDSMRFYAMFDDVLTIYMESRPLRMAAIRKVLQEMEAPASEFSLVSQVILWGAVMQKYHWIVGDTILLGELGTRVLSLGKLSEQGPMASFPIAYDKAIYFARDFMTRHEQIDSLRQSTNAYIAIRPSALGVVGQNEDAVFRMTGTIAAPIYGDFWFPPPSRVNDPSLNVTGKPIFPARGKISLIAFLDHSCVKAPARNSRWTGRCHSTYAMLRRLQKKYPAMDLIVVSQTRGFYQEGAVPLSPAEEAEWLRKGFAFEGLDAIVSVTNTPFWHLQVADRRRINDLTENIKNYMFGEPDAKFPVKNLFLVDENGVLISKMTSLDSRSSELGLDARIGALMQRIGAIRTE